MRLRRATIAGYKSIRESLSLELDEHVTIILGANDHGKTNVLSALEHLNPERTFDRERDLNWDYQEKAEVFPDLRFTFALSQEERKELRSYVQDRARLASLVTMREELESQLDQSEKVKEAVEARTDNGGEPTEDLGGGGEASTLLPAEAARLKVGALYGEEEKMRTSLFGESPISPDDAEASAKSATAKAKRLKTKATTARSAAPPSTGTAKPTDAEEKLETDARAAESEAELASDEADEWVRVARLARAQADAAKYMTDGKYSFWKDPKWPAPRTKLEDVPTEVEVARVGVAGELRGVVEGLDADVVTDYLVPRLPRVELLRPIETIPDKVTRQSVRAADNDFMRGILWYAGLVPDEWDGLFDQTDVSTMRLHRATDQLNQTLRASWSQGHDLRFRLDHNAGEIDLLIEDPSVETRFVRASRRSSGFTHFFALKTMLYARERASEASSFIWLFDEPGIFLHPEGQHDLLQVLETLSQTNQIVYVTHSIFLTNKNYPTRHRLLVKTAKGTVLDQKPYVGQWRSAIEALGLGFPGTFLFASKILLVEGDSDPILLYADIQKLIELGEFDADINGLAIMATGNSKHADALIRIFSESAIKPQIALLFDGDKGGADRLKNLKDLIDAKGLKYEELTKNTTVEDYLVAADVYAEATIQYLAQVFPEKDVRAELEESYKQRSPDDDGLAKWAREEGQNAVASEEQPSAVGIAREYLLLLQGAALDTRRSGRKRAARLAKRIAEMLDLPTRTAEQDQIVEPTAVEAS